MKIKPENRTRKKRLMARSRAYHKWLCTEMPRSAGRLAQLNKANKRARRRIGPSEFVLRMRKLEEGQ
jgi:hypothetical protein